MAGITIDNVHIMHGDYKLKGRVYRSSGDDPKPSAIICHGYPGDTKNMDLAEELALNGYNVLIFYYMGAWGSEGTYRFKNLTPSAKSALDWFVAQPYVDPSRVALISHSMGAVPLTNLMSADPRVKTGVLMSPASDLSLWLAEGVVDTIFEGFTSMSVGKLSMEDLDEYKADMIAAGTNLNPMDKVDTIKAPLMVIVGSKDEITIPKDCKALYDKATSDKEWDLTEGADHSYTEHRLPLQKSILDWLGRKL
jgi:dienelactone hydrolase